MRLIIASLLVSSVVLAGETSTTAPTTQAAQSPEQEMVLIDAKLANKDLSDAERFSLSARKRELRNKIQPEAPTSLQPAVAPAKLYILRQNAPIGIQQYLERCAAEKSRMLTDARVRQEQLVQDLRGMGRPVSREEALKRNDKIAGIRNEISMLTRVITTLVNPNTVVSPLLLDGTKTTQSLLPGMMGKCYSLKIITIVDNSTAIVHLFMPMRENKSARITTGTASYMDVINIPKHSAENPQDILLSGIDTSKFFDGAVYDNELIIELGEIVQRKGRRIPTAKVVNIDEYLVGQN